MAKKTLPYNLAATLCLKAIKCSNVDNFPRCAQCIWKENSISLVLDKRQIKIRNVSVLIFRFYVSDDRKMVLRGENSIRVRLRGVDEK